MSLIEDDYGDIIDTEQLYKCPSCGWIGLVSEMQYDSDCAYDGAVFSDYCCPKCWNFYSSINQWEKV